MLENLARIEANSIAGELQAARDKARFTTLLLLDFLHIVTVLLFRDR